MRFLSSLAGSIVGAVRAAWRTIRRRPAEVPREPRAAALAVTREEALVLLERHRRYLTLAPALERLVELQRRKDAEEADVAAALSRIQALLDAADVETGGEVGDRIAVFIERCRLRLQFERSCDAELEAKKRMEMLLNGTSREQVEAELAECRLHLGVESSSRPRGTSRDLARKRQELRDEHVALELEAEGLRKELQVTMSQHRSRAEVEEEAALARTRVAELERARKAMQIAVEAIEEAMVSVYRDFAPAVNTFLSDGIGRVTGGRYTRAHVDPKTLSISLLVPQTGMIMTDPPVSHGTRTLAYVLMRIGLAQHMSAVGEPVPLVLDDPFVDVDAERLPRILDYLSDLSERIQILIFTKDESLVEWCGGRGIEGQHRIHALSPSFSAAIASSL
jgi:DNA repair exonuclease SbcCD ATPase subunit